MALAPGSVTYMDYGQRRPRVTHTRLALALVEQDDWVILTPDYDMYVETLSAGNPDLQNFWVGQADGALPAGVPAGSVYGFQPLTAGEIARYMGEGRAEADLERGRRGIAPVVVGAAPAAVAAPVAPAPGVGANAPAMVWVLAEGIAGRKIGERVVPPAGHPTLNGWGLMELTDTDHVTRPCLIRQIAEQEVPGFCDERVQLARSTESCEGEDRAVSDDVRTLSVTYGMNGERQRGFRESVKELTMTEFEDFPLQPRTTLEYARAVASVAESCTAQHHVWVGSSRIPENDRSVFEDEVLARVLDAAVTYDCLNISNLASMELVVRRRQLLADAHSSSPGAPSYLGAEHYMGQTYKAGGGIVVPTLTDHVSKQLQAQSQIMKEKRKMEEAKGKNRHPKAAPKSPPKGGGGATA